MVPLHSRGAASESGAPILGDLPNWTTPRASAPLARLQGGLPLFRVQTRVWCARGGLVLVLVPGSPATPGRPPSGRPAGTWRDILAKVHTVQLVHEAENSENLVGCVNAPPKKNANRRPSGARTAEGDVGVKGGQCPWSETPSRCRFYP